MAICKKCGNGEFWPALGTATGKVEIQNSGWKLLDHMHPAKCSSCGHRQLISYDEISSMPPAKRAAR